MDLGASGFGANTWGQPGPRSPDLSVPLLPSAQRPFIPPPTTFIPPPTTVERIASSPSSDRPKVSPVEPKVELRGLTEEEGCVAGENGQARARRREKSARGAASSRAFGRREGSDLREMHHHCNSLPSHETVAT